MKKIIGDDTYNKIYNYTIDPHDKVNAITITFSDKSLK